jgi:hypothetical protein
VIEGAAILLAGLIIGWLGRGRAHKNDTDTLATRPGTCSCGHAKGVHLDGKGKCQANDTVTANKNRRGWACPCQMYDGPEPLPAYYAPEIQP